MHFKYVFMLLFLGIAQLTYAQKKVKIYQTGWIDFNKNGKKDVYENPKAIVEDRVKDLIAQMTLEEKTNQLATLYGYKRVLKDELPNAGWKTKIWKDGIANIDEHLNSLPYHPHARTSYSFPFSKHKHAFETIQKWFVEETRLGIPVDFTNEGLHGLNHEKATPFPSPINMGSTWNKDLIYRVGRTIGREGKLLGYTNIYSPILDVMRDPRWGRTMETYGEDPFLIAELGKQKVLGIQSAGVASTLKHFAVYSIPKGGRDGFARTDPHVSPKELHEMHLYPFRRVIQEAHPKGVMSSYNDWDGLPVTGSPYFLTELLRKEYGFEGYVVSDSEAVEYLYTKHQVATSAEDAVRLAIEAGLNVRTNFTAPEDYILPLRNLVKQGKVSMELLDARVGEVLKVKFQLGLFDNPLQQFNKNPDELVHLPSDDTLSLQVHRESMVLLKNEPITLGSTPLLPLAKGDAKKVLITGPMAKETQYMESRYGPSYNPLTSIYDGIVHQAGGSYQFIYAKGCEVVNEHWPETEIIPAEWSDSEVTLLNEALRMGKESDLIIAVMGQDEKRVGESLSRTSLDLPGRQHEFLRAMAKLGKPIILIFTAGQPMTINWEDRNIPAILNVWFPGAWGAKAVGELLFGDYNPSGRLSVTFPKSIGQIEWNFPFKKGSHNGQPGDGPNGYGNTAVIGSLYPFGFGLSYADFEYSNLKLAQEKYKETDTLRFSVDVKNVSVRGGHEVVQVYLTDDFSSVTTYDSLLKGFEKVYLKPGEKQTIQFAIPLKEMALLNEAMKWKVESGSFTIKVGKSSEDILLKEKFWVN